MVDDEKEDVPGSLPAADTLKPVSVAGTGGGPISWDACLDEIVEVCTERKSLRGEGGTEFKSGAMAQGRSAQDSVSQQSKDLS